VGRLREEKEEKDINLQLVDTTKQKTLDLYVLLFTSRVFFCS